MKSLPIFKEIKQSLQKLYRDRLDSVIVYGSYAREEEKKDSDIDLLILLNGPFNFGKELNKIIHQLYPLQLKIEQPIHAVPAEAKTYQSANYPLYRLIKNEGVTL